MQYKILYYIKCTSIAYYLNYYVSKNKYAVCNTLLYYEIRAQGTSIVQDTNY